ncbi:MAG TPA: hypothetical protein VN939_23340, partial [Chthoniobacterales bacterium]|nr:hypothetical protein [Chthoniobacterales bacterium]
INIGGSPWSTEAKIVVLASGRSETLYFCRGSSQGLINPGSPSKYRRITEPFLRSEGVNGLSFLNWTRSDQDHAGSAPELAKHFKVVGTSGLSRQSEAEADPSRRSGAEPDDVSWTNRLAKTAMGPVRFGEAKISLNDETAWNSIRLITPLNPVLDCELGSFEVIVLNTNRQQIGALPSRNVDVVVVPSQRQCSGPELIRKFRPQAILYLQGKPARNQTSGDARVPIWFIGEKGAVTMVLSNKDLELSGYLGDRLILRSRSR